MESETFKFLFDFLAALLWTAVAGPPLAFAAREVIKDNYPRLASRIARRRYHPNEDHKWGDWVLEPGRLEDRRVCELCGHLYYRFEGFGKPRQGTSP